MDELVAKYRELRKTLQTAILEESMGTPGANRQRVLNEMYAIWKGLSPKRQDELDRDWMKPKVEEKSLAEVS